MYTHFQVLPHNRTLLSPVYTINISAMSTGKVNKSAAPKHSTKAVPKKAKTLVFELLVSIVIPLKIFFYLGKGRHFYD